MPRAGRHYNLGTSRGPDKIGSRAVSCTLVLHVVESIAGMPNLRKNPFSTTTGFYRLFQSTDKKMIYGRFLIYGFVVTRFGYYCTTPPSDTIALAVFYGQKRFLDESTDFFVGATEFGYYYPPGPDPDFRRAATTRNFRIFRNSDRATLR